MKKNALCSHAMTSCCVFVILWTMVLACLVVVASSSAVVVMAYDSYDSYESPESYPQKGYGYGYGYDAYPKFSVWKPWTWKYKKYDAYDYEEYKCQHPNLHNLVFMESNGQFRELNTATGEIDQDIGSKTMCFNGDDKCTTLKFFQQNGKLFNLRFDFGENAGNGMISLGCTLNTFDINGAYCVQYSGNFFNQAISRPATAIVTFDYGNSEHGTKSKCKPTKVNFNWVWPATERQPSSLVYSIVYTPVDASSVRDPLDLNIKPLCFECNFESSCAQTLLCPVCPSDVCKTSLGSLGCSTPDSC